MAGRMEKELPGEFPNGPVQLDSDVKKFMFRRSRSRFWKAECRELLIRIGFLIRAQDGSMNHQRD